ncbi:MAG: tRNA (adenosine(37)-N6)-threonylcarbamoyltransferase complex dimerization subunit type 1 TsaB [Pseudomonadales bacterium]|nr:tRNA (adenosine(37)-N6)-threonylcarbamoyltransferase complex dimerization subunit type 1 TsaB [Pseudomonadales bacterium]
MKILALDTSTEACSVALYLDGEMDELYELIPRQHAARLLPMIQALMKENGLVFTDLDAIAFGQGPGSFTGLRIAAGVAQGVAFGAGLPIIPVSTLAALARQANRQFGSEYVLSCLDARIEEVYWGTFQVGVDGIIALQQEQLSPPEVVVLNQDVGKNHWFAAGNGWVYRPRIAMETLNRITAADVSMLPRAIDMAALAAIYYDQGLLQSPDSVAPVYLRDKVTHN